MKQKRGKLVRKGQVETVSVAVLIIVMAVFIIIYILSLPPGERERLLNITTSFLPFMTVSWGLLKKKFF